MDLLRIIIAILLPPLGVFLQVGIGKQFWINVVLTILGYIPGIIHAVWVIVNTNLSSLALRGCAHGSRSARRAALPPVASPGFSDEPAHDDRVREGRPEVDDHSSPLGTPHQLLVSVMPGVRALHDPAFRSL